MKTLALLALSLVACGTDGATKQDPCPRGICTGGGDDGGSGADGSGGCQEAWTCTPWQKQSDGTYTRSCTDKDECGTSNAKPPEGPITLPDLDVNFYKCNVEPILDRGCSFMNCHGTETGRLYKIYARGRLRMDEQVAPPGNYSCPDNGQTVPLKQGTGTVMCEGWFPHSADEWQSNYDNARFFMVGLQPSQASDSDLLEQPAYEGGKAHAGVHLLHTSDADYQTVRSWLSGEGKLASCDPSPN